MILSRREFIFRLDGNWQQLRGLVIRGLLTFRGAIGGAKEGDTKR